MIELQILSDRMCFCSIIWSVIGPINDPALRSSMKILANKTSFLILSPCLRFRNLRLPFEVFVKPKKWRLCSQDWVIKIWRRWADNLLMHCYNNLLSHHYKSTNVTSIICKEQSLLQKFLASSLFISHPASAPELLRFVALTALSKGFESPRNYMHLRFGVHLRGITLNKRLLRWLNLFS